MDSPPAKVQKRTGATYARASQKRRQSSSTSAPKRASSDSDSSLTSVESSDEDKKDKVVTRKPSTSRSVGRVSGGKSVSSGRKANGKRPVDWDDIPDETSFTGPVRETTPTPQQPLTHETVTSRQGNDETSSAVRTSTRRKMEKPNNQPPPTERPSSSAPATADSNLDSLARPTHGRPTRATSTRATVDKHIPPSKPEPAAPTPSTVPSKRLQRSEPPVAPAAPSPTPIAFARVDSPGATRPITPTARTAKSASKASSHLEPPIAILPRSNTIASPSPLRANALAGPSSPSKAGPTTPQRSQAGTPKALTPTQARHARIGTPTKSARDLSALFETHGHVGATGSSPELGSPQRKRVARRGSNSDEEEDDGPGSALVNLPKAGGGGLVGRMLKRSHTAPDETLSRAGSSTSDSHPTAPLGSPLRNKMTSDATGSSYFALSQSALHLIPTSPARKATAPAGAPSTPGSAPPSPGPTVAPTRPPLGQRRTYGGGTRSMLASMEGVGGEGVVVEDRGESYAVLSKRWGIEDEGLEDQDMIDLPTITELRARGENQRFLDDLGYIIDGLQAESIEVRRPSAVDLVRRLLDADFRRSVKTLDEAENVYTILREAGAGDGDTVLDAALAVFLSILSQDERSVDPILRRRGADCFDVVGKMLRSREDGFSLVRATARGKVVRSKDRAAVNLVTELARIHGLAREGMASTVVSLRGIASSLLASVVGWSGSRVDRFAVLEQAGVATRVAASFEAEIEGLPARLEAHAKGLPLLPEKDGPDFAHVEHCLTVLENLVVRFPDVQQMVEQTRPNLARLLGTLLVVSLALSTTEDAGDDESSEPSVSLMGLNALATTLRVLVNVTNTSQFWCEGILACTEVLTALLRIILRSDLPNPTSDTLAAKATLLSSPMIAKSTVIPSSSPLPAFGELSGDAGAVDSAETAEAIKVDVLCLALGLLNNLVEGVPDTRNTIRETELSSTCSGSRSCVLQCRCADRRSGLLVLVDFYAKQLSSTGTESSYLSGYSILLLSHLLDTSPTNTPIILDALPSPSLSSPSTSSDPSAPTTTSTHQTKLLRMATELRDFADVHQRFHDKLTTLAATKTAATDDDEETDKPEALPAVVPSVEQGVGAVQRMIGVLEGLAAAEGEYRRE